MTGYHLPALTVLGFLYGVARYLVILKKGSALNVCVLTFIDVF